MTEAVDVTPESAPDVLRVSDSLKVCWAYAEPHTAQMVWFLAVRDRSVSEFPGKLMCSDDAAIGAED